MYISHSHMLTCSGDPFVSCRPIEQEGPSAFFAFFLSNTHGDVNRVIQYLLASKLNHYILTLTIDCLLVPLQHYSQAMHFQLISHFCASRNR